MLRQLALRIIYRIRISYGRQSRFTTTPGILAQSQLKAARQE
jgi:hypothetical protein